MHQIREQFLNWMRVKYFVSNSVRSFILGLSNMSPLPKPSETKWVCNMLAWQRTYWAVLLLSFYYCEWVQSGSEWYPEQCNARQGCIFLQRPKQLERYTPLNGPLTLDSLPLAGLTHRMSTVTGQCKAFRQWSVKSWFCWRLVWNERYLIKA